MRIKLQYNIGKKITEKVYLRKKKTFILYIPKNNVLVLILINTNKDT